MTRMTPAQYVAGNRNATGGGAATPTSTSGVRTITNRKKETVMPHTNPRPWLDEATAHLPTEWVTEKIAFLRELADKAGDHGIAAGLESAALVLETELSSYRNGGAA